MRVVIADDHPVVSDGIGRLIAREFTSVITVSAASDLIRVVRNEHCDLIITDLNMPGSNDPDGFRLIEHLQRSMPRVPLIVHTMLSIPAVLDAIVGISVRGLVHKRDAFEELRLAAQTVLQGDRYISTSISYILFRSSWHHDTSRMPLTPKEADILRLFCMGLTVSEIARFLNRSVKTVSGHKCDLMDKLGLSSDLALFEFVRHHAKPLQQD